MATFTAQVMIVAKHYATYTVDAEDEQAAMAAIEEAIDTDSSFNRMPPDDCVPEVWEIEIEQITQVSEDEEDDADGNED